jgi:hypothetical protein
MAVSYRAERYRRDSMTATTTLGIATTSTKAAAKRRDRVWPWEAARVIGASPE